MSLTIISKCRESIKGERDIPLNLENIAVKLDSPKINVRLDDMERYDDRKKSGLRISVNILGLGIAYFNEIPYSSREIAIKEYKRVVEHIKEGNYMIELYGIGKLRLILTDY